MFLKRRNLFAWVLILAATLAWAAGGTVWRNAEHTGVETTAPSETTIVGGSVYTDPEMIGIPSEPSASYSADEVRSKTGEDILSYNQSRGLRMLALLLAFAGAAAAVVAVFILRQTEPLFGPDGCIILVAVLAYVDAFSSFSNIRESGFLGIWVVSFLVLLSMRELWGWIYNHLRLSWCAIHRITVLCKQPLFSLLIFLFWICTFLIGGVLLVVYNELDSIFSATGLLLVSMLGLCCLCRYGMDLHHLQKQLENFRNSQQILVRDGAFSDTEAQLLEIQVQHAEAIQTAVASERFKVELIANVSHDLRTPLTSILGYSELLQEENLSDTGKLQLQRLTQRAGYMRDLVESLFELTKVSSGVTESNRETIDLIRLLEQTLGLFDDRLSASGIGLRRHYCADSVSVVTDGARMHQVFANLLGNAIKYSLAGTRIHLEVTEQQEFIRIRLVNTASYEMDFSPEEITQRFARGDKARTTVGSGLGLAIAQTYTESVGGQFHVEVDGDQFSAIVLLPKN